MDMVSHNSPTGSVVRHVLGIVNCIASYEVTHMQGLYGHQGGA